MELNRPTTDYVRQRIAEFDGNPKYYGAEQTVELVFRQWPHNTEYSEVLAKVIVLNRLYSTNIFDPYSVAAHIVDQAIDERLGAGDEHLIESIASVTFSGGKTRRLYSFTTKYCGWHQPDAFQIYDSYVAWMLWEYRKAKLIGSFKKYEMDSYSGFVRVVGMLVDQYGLHEFSKKQIDKFLWIEGVEVYRARQASKQLVD